MPLMIAASLLLVAAQSGQVVAPAPIATPSPVQSVVYAPPPAATVQVPAATVVTSPSMGQGDVLGDSVMILVELFVLAVVLESALALIFTWAPFRETFNGQGVKPLVSFAAALALTGLFHTEILAKVVESYGGRHDHASDFLGQLIDSMIIAGGSSGVHAMLQKLGIRLPNASDADVPRPPITKAWLAVLLKRRLAKGAVQVEIAAAPARAVRRLRRMRRSLLRTPPCFGRYAARSRVTRMSRTPRNSSCAITAASRPRSAGRWSREPPIC